MKEALKNCADKPKAKKAKSTSSRTIRQQEKKLDNLVKITLLKTGVVIKLPEGFSEKLEILMKCFIHEMKAHATQQALNIPSLLAERQNKPSFYISELSFGTFLLFFFVLMSCYI